MLSTSTVEIQRTFVGYNATGASFGLTYFKGISSDIGAGVIADVVRMIGTCIVEHWDVAQSVDPGNSTNPHPFF